MKQPTTQNNNPEKAGQKASQKIIFGPFNRYAVYAVHTRFDKVQWFVEDAEQNCDVIPEQLKIIRQEWDFKDAVKRLEDDLQFYWTEANDG